MVGWATTNTVRTFDTGSAAAAGGISTTAPAALGGGTTGSSFGGFGFASDPSSGAAGPAPSTSATTAFPSFGTEAAAASASNPAPPSPFGTSAPAAPFGTPAPTPSAPGFGGVGFYGSTTPAPATPTIGTFGSSMTTSAGLYGGGLSGGGFGQAPQQQPMPSAAMLVPAQAALQAHQNAEARQEEARVVAALSSIHRAYSGAAVCPDDGGTAATDYFVQPSSSASTSSSSAPFTLIYYTDISPELRQQQWLQGMIVGGDGGATTSLVRPVVPPRPWQVSSRDWRAAAARNPDPATHMPAVLLGASALQSRISYQQEAATKLTEQFQLVKDTLEALAQRSKKLQQEVADKVRLKHEQQRSQLLSVMRKVELVRSFQIPIQHGELLALERLANLHRNLERTVQPTIRHLHDRAQQQLQQPPPSSGGRGALTASLSPDQISELENVLKNEFGPGIDRMQSALEKPVRDVALLKKRIEHAPLPALPPPPSLRR